jgi:hypothetical protein
MVFLQRRRARYGAVGRRENRCMRSAVPSAKTMAKQSGDSIPIHQGSGICLHRKAVAIPVGEQPNLLEYVRCHRIRPEPGGTLVSCTCGAIAASRLAMSAVYRQDVPGVEPPFS